MKIKIFYYDEKFSWDKYWVFLGGSFKKLRTIEKKITGPRIKINDFLHECFEEELQNYLEWTESQRTHLNDSVYWWMTELAGRNTANSNFFLYICQIKALIKILDKSKENEILIVCDDILLIQTIIKNLNHISIKKSNLLKFKIFKNTFSHYFKFLRNLLISIIDLVIRGISTKITLKNKNLPKGNICLVHQYAEIDSLKNDKNFKTRYFPYLKEFFFKEKIDLYSLTWFSPFRSKKIKAFKKIRENNFFIPEDWLNFNDYIIVIKNFLKVKLSFEIVSQYPDLDISYLILREKRIYLEHIHYNLRFWTYLPSLKKWVKNCNSLICIDHYENMIFEVALIAAARELNIKTKIIGYHHTLSSKEFVGWHSLDSEWSSKFKPDYVMSLGSISTKMLTEQGVPKNRIIEGAALRYNNLLIKKKTIKKKNYILVPLSHVKDSSLELITAIKKLSKKLEKTEYKFIIKPHPNLDISKVLNTNELSKLSNNISISKNDLDSLLDECLLTIFMSTGAAYSAALNGNIVLNLRSELNLMDNYLDIFKKDFKFTDANSLNTIEKILIEFINDDKKVEEYALEFERLSKHLISGMNIVNDTSLSKFIQV